MQLVFLPDFPWEFLWLSNLYLQLKCAQIGYIPFQLNSKKNVFKKYVNINFFFTSSCSVRGALNSLFFIIISGSQILGFILSMFFDYKQQAMCTALVVPIFFFSQIWTKFALKFNFFNFWILFYPNGVF